MASTLDVAEKEESNVEEYERPVAAERLVPSTKDAVQWDVLLKITSEAVRLLLVVWSDALEEALEGSTDFEPPTVAEMLVPLSRDVVARAVLNDCEVSALDRVLDPLATLWAVTLLLDILPDASEEMSEIAELVLSGTSEALLIGPLAEKAVECDVLNDRGVSVAPRTAPTEDDIERGVLSGSKVSVPVKRLEPPFTPRVVSLLLDAPGSGVITDSVIGNCVSDVLGAFPLVLGTATQDGPCNIELEVCGMIGMLKKVALLLDADKMVILVDVRLESIVTSCGIEVEVELAERVNPVEEETSPMYVVEIDVLVDVWIEITVTSCGIKVELKPSNPENKLESEAPLIGAAEVGTLVDVRLDITVISGGTKIELKFFEMVGTTKEEKPMVDINEDVLVGIPLETSVISWGGKIEFAGWGMTIVIKLEVPVFGNVGAAAIVPFKKLVLLMMFCPPYGDWAPTVTPACVVVIEDEETLPLPVTTKHSTKTSCHILTAVLRR
ncbi:hypothetical protein LTS10_004268 [Elasticomyces elasticus]|nr:hypothetical protein LTS10_004268 [Elasticomyces elasticus]